jgi:hypothetical protein
VISKRDRVITRKKGRQVERQENIYIERGSAKHNFRWEEGGWMEDIVRSRRSITNARTHNPREESTMQMKQGRPRSRCARVLSLLRHIQALGQLFYGHINITSQVENLLIGLARNGGTGGDVSVGLSSDPSVVVSDNVVLHLIDEFQQ